MNSVLEPEREILLAEKIGQETDGVKELTENVIAIDSFRFVGTMNPGGDYGKKELSPALKTGSQKFGVQECRIPMIYSILST